MYSTAFISQVAIVTIPGILLLAFAHYLFRLEFDKYLSFKFTKTVKTNNEHLLPLKLQAHERMIVFVERINPSNVLIRLHQQGISVPDLQSLVINEINSEYQHNITQQLYLTDATWEVIRKLKEDTLSMIGNAAKGLPEGAHGVDLGKRMLQHLAGMEENPYDLTLHLIKKDLHQAL